MTEKIVHINSSGSGGAFVAAKLLHESFLKNGFQSKILTRFYENKEEGIYKHSFLGNRSLKRFLKKVFGLNKPSENSNFAIFSPPLKRSNISKNKLLKDAETVYIHWVADFLSVREVAEISKSKKVFWTLHDMNPFTGGCHHSDDCVQYMDGCKNCPQLKNEGEKVSEYFKIKKEVLDKIDSGSLTIISPSEWMFERASKSALLKKFRHIMIPHFVDANVLKYMEKDEARKLLELPETKKIFLYVSAVLENRRKGFDKVLELAENMKDSLFVFMGKTKNRDQIEKPENIVVVDDAFSPELMAKYYSAADYLLNFSVAESFGLTTVESLCCGTPVVCYDIPIMREHIEDGINGIFVKDIDTDFFLQAFDREKIAENAMEKYGHSNFEKYLELYER
ncbi:MAG: glycosyltransferase [bacterium]